MSAESPDLRSKGTLDFEKFGTPLSDEGILKDYCFMMKWTNPYEMSFKSNVVLISSFKIADGGTQGSIKYDET